MPRGGARSLVLWSWILLALVAAHDVTHIADDGLETELGQLAVVAIPQWLALIVLMGVVLRGGRTAALLLGASVAVGFGVVHLLPLSPAAFWDLQPSVVSWRLIARAAKSASKPSRRSRIASGGSVHMIGCVIRILFTV